MPALQNVVKGTRVIYASSIMGESVRIVKY